MKTLSPFSVKEINSFNVESIAPRAYFPKTIDDLVELANLSLSNFYILGEGFNTLFVKETTPIIIKPEFKGIEIQEHENCTTVKAAASENWHSFVEFCIEQGINGLENLAFIPGSVGAAPVQNIGAYGVELASYCMEVEWFDFETKSLIIYQHKDCEFAYRESVFKQTLKNKGIIVSVTFRFPKAWQANLSYAGLDHLPFSVSAKKIMDEVIKVRQAKLPDPYLLPNAGSFFKNPVIDGNQWKILAAKYPNIPSYPQGDGKVKVAAGWLIEKTGLKGYQHKGVGVHEKQALVLVNYNAGQGKYIVDLAIHITNKVKSLFNIDLEPEVRMVFPQGEMNLVEYKNG
ncbi:UDP-N-acetylmuramate dehydrogenase [Colwellia sp. UCD-KL20]|uniref:UDP-N-acetylmuramate dehydrogenase n=1 Tax=Colwellia sp. UCD-KL20 TaxID=1917165 RepID=UPI000970BFBF|nr:UDP-N-acetylmuramate dehydrogenase [Colwellia sp. UCD-KL20]